MGAAPEDDVPVGVARRLAGYEISADPDRQDLGVIRGFLSGCDWARGISRELVEQAVRNSLCVGAYRNGAQVGFARAVTDRATFAYFADVFVLPPHRRRGLASALVATLMSHPDLRQVRRLLLSTRAAHGLYARLGFVPLSNPADFMTIHRVAAGCGGREPPSGPPDSP